MLGVPPRSVGRPQDREPGDRRWRLRETARKIYFLAPKPPKYGRGGEKGKEEEERVHGVIRGSREGLTFLLPPQRRRRRKRGAGGGGRAKNISRGLHRATVVGGVKGEIPSLPSLPSFPRGLILRKEG